MTVSYDDSDDLTKGQTIACLTVIFAMVAAAGLGIVSKVENSHVDKARTASLENAATTACTVPSARDDVAAGIQKDCLRFVQYAIQRGDANSLASTDSLDSKWFHFFPDNEGNRFYAHAMDVVKNTVPGAAAAQFNKRELLSQSDAHMRKAVKDITVDGEKPFANAAVDIDTQSVVPIIGANGKETGVYTGKFKVVITDQDSNAARVFEYDHATGNVSQTMGSTSGTFSFHLDLSGYGGGFLGGPQSLSGGGSGTISLQTTGPVSCEGNKRTACAVIGALHQALNRLDPAQMSNLRTAVANTARYYRGSDQSGTALAYTMSTFPEFDFNGK